MSRDDKTREIINRSERQLKEYYRAGVPQIASERLNREIKEHLETTGEATLDQMLSFRECSKSAHDAGKMPWPAGAVTNTIFTFLLGYRQPNPLPAHYYCEECGFFEPGELTFGLDLPERKCPRCGKHLRRDGFSLPEEFAWGKKNELYYEDVASKELYSSTENSSIALLEKDTVEKVLRNRAFGIPNTEIVLSLWHEGDLTYQRLANCLLSSYASVSGESGEELDVFGCYRTLEEYGIFCREDISDSMRYLGANRNDAFSTAERIRKGYYHSEYSNKKASNALPDGIKEMALHVRYLPSRGQAAVILNNACHTYWASRWDEL